MTEDGKPFGIDPDEREVSGDPGLGQSEDPIDRYLNLLTHAKEAPMFEDVPVVRVATAVALLTIAKEMQSIGSLAQEYLSTSKMMLAHITATQSKGTEGQ